MGIVETDTCLKVHLSDIQILHFDKHSLEANTDENMENTIGMKNGQTGSTQKLYQLIILRGIFINVNLKGIQTNSCG